MDIETSLLREKFTIQEAEKYLDKNALEIYAPSTRMPITLQAGESTSETYVVRTQNMHSCVRIVSKIAQEYEKKRPYHKPVCKIRLGVSL